MLTGKNIQNIYELSPMQEGIYFQSLSEEDSMAYFSQVSYRFRGTLRIDWVEQCLNTLLKRHDILRTVFNHKKSDAILQVVLREQEIDFRYEDIRDMVPRVQEQYLEVFLKKDRTSCRDSCFFFKKKDCNSCRNSFFGIWTQVGDTLLGQSSGDYFGYSVSLY